MYAPPDIPWCIWLNNLVNYEATHFIPHHKLVLNQQHQQELGKNL